MASRKIEIVDNACAVGIIYRASDPRQVFLEMKDDGYPRKAFRRMGCLIGGNWVGETARGDLSPIDTFKREVSEELSFDKAVVDPIELTHLHEVNVLDFSRSSSSLVPSPEDKLILQDIVKEIRERALPYATYLVTVPRKVFIDQEEKYSDWRALICVFQVPLPEDVWGALGNLQYKFGNLSNESITLMTSLDEIIATGFRISWGHDRVLKQFFRERCGDAAVENFPMVPHIRTVYKGVPRHSYDYYFKRYAFRLTPFGPSRVRGGVA